jgi:peptidyl-prolyl cis-trans isomerase C
MMTWVQSYRVMGLIREPLLHFVVIGVALFALHRYVETRFSADTIVISQERIRAIADNYRLQYGVLPSSAQRNALVDRFIDEEVMYREALRLGLDANDEIVRRRLVQKYEFLEQDLTVPAEPKDSELINYYQAHLQQYEIPEKATFTHVYFSTDRLGETGARAATEKLASRLNLRRITRAADEGDRFPGPSDFAAVSGTEIERVFGQEGLTQAVFNVEPNRWSSPLRSGFGWHSVYVSARQPGRQATFEEARESVRRDFIEEERNRRNAQTLATLRRQFNIVRESPSSGR